MKHELAKRLLAIILMALPFAMCVAQDYNIIDFGATSEGAVITTYLQEAIDEAHANGGGRVVVPQGEFVSGTIFMKSNVELHLEKNAFLLGSLDPQDYERRSYWTGFVFAVGQRNISITGEGTIDGRGRAVAMHIDSLFYAGEIDSSGYNFAEKRPKYNLRPQLIVFIECQQVAVRDVQLRNAASWVQTYDKCNGLEIDGITVDSDAYWNNDGLDISDCRNVRITNCVINSADDGICLKSHSRDHICDSIYIANCTVRSSASAVKFGTRSYGGFTNVIVKDIKVFDTFRSAIAIECVDGGRLDNVLVENVNATNTGNAIFIRLGKRKPDHGSLRNVTLRNIKAEIAFERPDYAYDMRGPALPFFHNIFPSSITGIPGHPIEDVVLENIDISYPGRGNKAMAYSSLSRLDEIPEEEQSYPEYSMFGELPAWGFYVRHVEGLVLRNVRIGIAESDYRPAIVIDSSQGVSIESLDVTGDLKDKWIIIKDSDVLLDDEARAERY